MANVVRDDCGDPALMERRYWIRKDYGTNAIFHWGTFASAPITCTIHLARPNERFHRHSQLVGYYAAELELKIRITVISVFVDASLWTYRLISQVTH